ncbi:MAG: hypothetical protein IPP72_12875 [Chitinophagaceae bacterium]|nr:hypothetical protein [Chitinophagaceae bacterium]
MDISFCYLIFKVAASIDTAVVYTGTLLLGTAAGLPVQQVHGLGKAVQLFLFLQQVGRVSRFADAAGAEGMAQPLVQLQPPALKAMVLKKGFNCFIRPPLFCRA